MNGEAVREIKLSMVMSLAFKIKFILHPAVNILKLLLLPSVARLLAIQLLEGLASVFVSESQRLCYERNGTSKRRLRKYSIDELSFLFPASLESKFSPSRSSSLGYHLNGH